MITKVSPTVFGNYTEKSATSSVALVFGVIRTGFEPVTHSLEGCCSIQLSYRTIPSKSGCKYSGFL